jgi:hypothetical protein
MITQPLTGPSRAPARSRAALLRSLAACLCAATGVVWSASAPTPARASAAPRPATPPAPFVIPQSVFVDDPSQGLDPFFPDSTRRQQSAAKASTEAPLSGSKITATLNLRGIVMGNRNRRMALINNQIFEAGETKTNAFLIEGVSVSVHCLDIREDSVLVTVGSKPDRYELSLRKSSGVGGTP